MIKLKEKSNAESNLDLKVVYIALGSNLGDREHNLIAALRAINSTQDMAVTLVSNIYETEPVGNVNQGPFLNMAARIITKMDPHELLDRTQDIEALLGRTREERWGPRTIDIDILMYENVVISDERLVLPHPEMYRRAFVLVPLSEVFLNDVNFMTGDSGSLLYHASGCEDFNDINIYKDFDDKLFKLNELKEQLYDECNFRIYNSKISIGSEVLAFDEISSTNEYAKKLAQNGAREGLVITSVKQKFGRGRNGRKWSSENPEGIWFSIILRPRIPPADVLILTHLIAVSVVELIMGKINVKCGIKWPNDIVIEGKKVCGILCESSFHGENCEYVIAGVGLNVNQTEFEYDIRNIAVSLRMISGKFFDKGELFNELLKITDKHYEVFKSGEKQKILDLSRKYSITIGQKIRSSGGENDLEYYALGISDTGNLIVRDQNGKVEEIGSGEVSVRGIYDAE